MGEVVMAESAKRARVGSAHVVTLFSLRDGGQWAWCTCGDRFDTNVAQLAEAWAVAHGSEVLRYPAAGHHSAA
jgi:hypothetical protein